MLSKLFPWKNDEELKVYAMLSIHESLMPFLKMSGIRLVIAAAYSYEEALRQNEVHLESTVGIANMHSWKPSLAMTQIPFQQIVPLYKVVEMVDKIAKTYVPQLARPEGEMQADKIESYCRFAFEKAGASAYERGILTGILKRFRSNIISPNPPQKI